MWAVERLHTYLFGGHFTLYTDCKPVELILNNAKSRPPARIERWNLRLQEYHFTTVHTKGPSNPSDFLSRHPSPEVFHADERSAERYVNFIASHSTPKAMSLDEIKQATKRDKTLQKLTELIRSNKLAEVKDDSDNTEVNFDELKLFSRVRDELTISEDDDFILRGTRIIIPSELRQRALALAHEGHQGLVKTKQLLREKIWFPRIDQEVETLLNGCLACQANGPNTKPDPLQMSPLPPTPWHTVHIDFCGPFPTGEYLLVVIDAYSRFPEVDIVHSTAAKGTISKLERIFSTHGIPVVIRSDNGPPFTSSEFQSYMAEIGAKHQRITPLWPQANSEAENFMKPLTKTIRAARTEQKDWKKELYTFLLNYRATPHSTTGYPPSELLFNRSVRTKLPQTVTVRDSQKDSVVRSKDERAKSKMKQYADVRRKARHTVIQVGDRVLLRQRKQNKFSTRFDPKPFRVTRKKGTMITAFRNGKYVTRNSSLFKKVNLQLFEEEEESDEDDDDSSAENDSNDRNETRAQNSDRNDRRNESGTRRYPRRNRKQLNRYGQNIYES